jgi:hypothetical protein
MYGIVHIIDSSKTETLLLVLLVFANGININEYG